MQVALLLDRWRVRLDLIWTPRDKNSLADALTNGDFTGFSEHLSWVSAALREEEEEHSGTTSNN
eukprot:3588864-Amphidinium_carterae.1